jgi:hypothetical protein
MGRGTVSASRSLLALSVITKGGDRGSRIDVIDLEVES